MDFLALPDEMIASVFKHAKFETTTRIRKLNNRIDKITVYYGVNHPKIYKLKFERVWQTIEIVYFPSEIFEREQPNNASHRCYSFEHINCEDGHYSEILEKYLSKTRNHKGIELHDVFIDNQWLNVLNIKNAKKISLNLLSCKNKVTFKNLTALLAKFRKVSIDWKVEHFSEKRDPTTDKILTRIIATPSIIGVTIRCYAARLCLEITDATLEAAEKVRLKSFILEKCLCSFTIEKVLETLKKLLTTDLSDSLKWNLGIVNLSSREELDRIVVEFAALDKNIQSKKAGRGMIIYYKGPHPLEFEVKLTYDAIV